MILQYYSPDNSVLLCRPNPTAFGHTCLDILLAYHLALFKNTKACFIRNSDRPAWGPFLLRSKKVETVSQDHLGSKYYWKMQWAFRDGIGWLEERIKKDGRPDKLSRYHQEYRYFGQKHRHLVAKQKLEIYLPPEVEKTALQAASELGLSPHSPVVTLHVRDSRSKSHNDPKDQMRDGSLENYFPAIEALVQSGFTVVRIGDPAMPRLDQKGVIDLAHSDHRGGPLEWWALLQSQFFIGCDSGPYCAALLAETPCLCINTIEPFSSYPIYPQSRYLLKRIFDRDKNQELGLSEILALLGPGKFFKNEDALRRYEFIENTADEILNATREMMDLTTQEVPATESQQDFEQMVLDSLSKKNKLGKVEQEFPFLGEGKISQSFLETYKKDSKAAQTPQVQA